MKRALAVAVAVALAACTRKPREGAGTLGAADGGAATAAEPTKPLATYCKPGSCPTYEASIGEVKKLGSPGGGPGCVEGEAGSCGALRYVYYNDGFGSFERWFDASGALVGVRTSADFDPAGARIGVVPARDSCERTKTLALCAPR